MNEKEQKGPVRGNAMDGTDEQSLRHATPDDTEHPAADNREGKQTTR